MEEARTEKTDVAKKVMARASVQYPYFDLADSLAVAQAIHDQAGGACSPDQLAAYLGYKSTKSGTYQTRLSAAKQFGFVRNEDGSLVATERAMKIISPVMPEDAAAAMADAFLSVELFGKIYERYKGSTIPPKVGIRNLLTQDAFSLPEDRLDPTVRILFDSAQQAGMFPSGDQTRLVRPASKPATAPKPHHFDQPPPPPSDQHRGGGSGGGDAGPPGVHSAIVGLLRELPASGSVWPKRSKDRFVKAFLATLDFVYQTDDEEESP